MKIIDGKNAVMGRLASYAAKEALKGEEVAVVNCREVIITGSREGAKERLRKMRARIGSGQQGPKVSRIDYKIVKRAIRGMLPNHREGKGREAWKRIKCYSDEPEEFKSQEKINLAREGKKNVKVGEISK